MTRQRRTIDRCDVVFLAITFLLAGVLALLVASPAGAAADDFGPVTGNAIAQQSPPGSCPGRPNTIPFTATVTLRGDQLAVTDPGGDATGTVKPDGSAHLTSPQGETYDVQPSTDGKLHATENNGGCTFDTTISFEQPLPPLAQTPPTQSASSQSNPTSQSSTASSTTNPPVHPGGSSLTWLWVVLLVAGGIVLVVAWIAGRGPLLVAATHDCDDELRRWHELQTVCDEERAAAAQADARADDARRKRADLATKVAAYHDAHPGIDPAGDNSYVEDVATGERVTITDVELQRQAEQAIYAEYRRTGGHDAVEHAIDEFRKADTPEARAARRKQNQADRAEYTRMQDELRDATAAQDAAVKDAEAAHRKADAACRQADVARRSYEECIRQAAEAAVTDAASADDGLPTDDLPKPKVPVPTTVDGGGRPGGDDRHDGNDCDCGFAVEIVGPDTFEVSECLEYTWTARTPAPSEVRDDIRPPGDQCTVLATPVRPDAQRQPRVREPDAGQLGVLFATRVGSACWGGATIGAWRHRWTVTGGTTGADRDVLHVHVEVTAQVQCPGQSPRTVTVEADKDVRIARSRCCCGPDITDDFVRCLNEVIRRLATDYGDRGALDSGLNFLAVNGFRMVYRPIDGLGETGPGGCPCLACCDTVTILDVCVNAHFTGDLLFGLCAGWFEVNWGALTAGGNVAKWGHYPGLTMPDTSVATKLWEDGYDLGQRAWQAYTSDHPDLAAARITRQDLAPILEHIRSAWRRDCDPCPHPNELPAPKDFSRFRWVGE